MRRLFSHRAGVMLGIAIILLALTPGLSFASTSIGLKASPSVDASFQNDGLVVTKMVSPNTIPVNSTTTLAYVIKADNAGQSKSSVSKIFDGLPNGFSYVPGSTLLDDKSFKDPEITILPFNEFDPNSGFKTMLTWDTSGTRLEPGEKAELSFKAQAIGVAEGHYCNVAWVSPDGETTRTGNTAKVTVGNPIGTDCPGEHVMLSTSAKVEPNLDHNPADPNDDLIITYTNVIENKGNSPLTMWQYRNKLPEGFQYQFGSTSGDITFLDPFALTIGNRQNLHWFFIFPPVFLPANGKLTHTFQATAPHNAGEYYNEFWLFFLELPEIDAAYSWPSALVDIPEDGVDISVTKVDSPDPVSVGKQLTYSIEVTNHSSSTARVMLEDEFQEGKVKLESVKVSHGSCRSKSFGLVDCNLGTLEPGKTATLDMVVIPLKVGQLTNVAKITSDQPDPNLMNNASRVYTTVVP